MTLNEKIQAGLLKRSEIESIKAEAISIRDTILAEGNKLSGFNRDIFFNNSIIVRINDKIKACDHVLKLMNEMKVA